MRRVVEVLRKDFDLRYPLAYAAPYLQPDGRRMLWQAQNLAELPDEFAAEVDTGQFTLTPWVAEFAGSTTFDESAGGAAVALVPDVDFPAIQLNPVLCGGEPIIDGRHVRVAAVAGLTSTLPRYAKPSTTTDRTPESREPRTGFRALLHR
jgi:hypothetical protein